MTLKVKVRVPATTANMGPGFDCLGMALAMYNEVEFEIAGCAAGHGKRSSSCTFPCSKATLPLSSTSSDGERGSSCSFSRSGKLRSREGSSTTPESKNLIYRSFVSTLRRLGVIPQSVIVRTLKAGIPVARGLGSSAACIVAGVLAAREAAAKLGGEEMSLAQAIDLAVEIEGHPDNVVPAVLGGMTVAVWTGESSTVSTDGTAGAPGASKAGSGYGSPAGETRRRVVCCRIDPPRDLTLAAFVPDFRLATEQARGALPATYSREDAVFNIGRAALLLASLVSGDFSCLRTAVDDRIHQPYRLPLIAHSNDVISAARTAGSEAEFVSGSGPTIMALVRGDGNAFAQDVSRELAGIPGGWVLHLLKPDDRGAVAWVE